MKVRNKNDNIRYVDHLDEAIDKVEQAIDDITYSSYPELNKRLITKLQEVAELLEACSHAAVFKP
jgi:hypothetical protein